MAPPRPWGLKSGSLNSGDQETRAPPHVSLRPIHSESATARKFAQVHCGRSRGMSGAPSTHLPGGWGETEAAQPPAQRGQPQHRSRLAGRPGRASLWRAGDGYLEELGSLLQELQSRTLGEAAGSPGARRPGSRRAEGETLWEGAAHPSSCRRPVRRSPRAVAAAAASGLRSPGRPREGTLKGARSPLAPVSDAGRRGC